MRLSQTSSQSSSKLPHASSSFGADLSHFGARASAVNRTHRVVRERARLIKSARGRARSLWIPMAVCAVLLVISVLAVWTMLDQYEISPTGIPDASDQMLVMLLWFLPASAALLAMVWFRRTRTQPGDEFRP